MYKFKLLRDISIWLRALSIIILAIFLTAPFGCSKEGEEQSTETADVDVEDISSGDPAKDHFDRGVRFSLMGQYDEAIEEYKGSLKLNPNSPDAYSNLGFAYLDKGEFDQAIENQKKALELNSGLANAYYGLALALERRGGEGDKEEALKNWNEYLNLATPHTRWWNKANEHAEKLKGELKAAKEK